MIISNITLFNKIQGMSACEVLARTLYGEARGEFWISSVDKGPFCIHEPGTRGLLAVGNVVMNRVKLQTWYGKCPKTVCLKPYQFSCWNEGDVNLRKLLEVDEETLVYRVCLFVASALLRYESQGGLDITGEADHYYSVHLKKPPYWIDFADKVCKIGNHVFYKMRHGNL